MNPLSLIKKIPGGEDAIEKVKDTVSEHPILAGVTLVALGAIMVLAIFFGITIPASVLWVAIPAFVVIAGGKFILNRYLKEKHGEKTWFKTMDRVSNVALILLGIVAAETLGLSFVIPALVVLGGGKLMMNNKLKEEHGEKEWFKTIDHVMTVSLIILGAIALTTMMAAPLPADPFTAVMTAQKASIPFTSIPIPVIGGLLGKVSTVMAFPMSFAIPLGSLVTGCWMMRFGLDKKATEAEKEHQANAKWWRAAHLTLDRWMTVMAPIAYCTLLFWMMYQGPLNGYFAVGLATMIFTGGVFVNKTKIADCGKAIKDSVLEKEKAITETSGLEERGQARRSLRELSREEQERLAGWQGHHDEDLFRL